MKVRLISHTEEPEVTCARAMRSCRTEKICMDNDITWARSMIKKGMKMKHYGILEHASFTFAVEGVSRALTHQLVRHRIASYCQQSQRAVRMDKPSYVEPPSISSHFGDTLKDVTMFGSPEDVPKGLGTLYHRVVNWCFVAYEALVKSGIPEEDARFVLPNACTTNIVITMNARSLLHFFSLRLDSHAQWEIMQMAGFMHSLAMEKAPSIFEKPIPEDI